MVFPVDLAAPPALRLRPVQPLFDRHQACPAVYDLERAMLLPVPEELHLHLATTLEAGDLDDALVGWLAGEDLLTNEERPEESSGEEPFQPLAEIDGGAGGVWFVEDEIHFQPPRRAEATLLEALDALVAGTGRGARVVVHLVSAGGLARPRVLERVIAAIAARARDSGRQLVVELTTDGRGLTPPVVRRLLEHEVRVRLVAGSSRWDRRTVELLADRLTLCALLDTGDRLADLWHRAVALGVRRLDATKMVDRPFDGAAVVEAELRQYRRDLFAIADATFDALTAGAPARPSFEPLARVVRRQLSGRSAAVASGGSAGYFGLVGREGIHPLWAPLGAAATARPAGDPAAGESFAPEVEASPACRSCWGRRLCARSRYAIADAGPFRPGPRSDRCEFWRAELEVGLLLYQRLERADPASFLGLAEERTDTPAFDPYVGRVDDRRAAS